jgi:hypothetical protein
MTDNEPTPRRASPAWPETHTLTAALAYATAGSCVLPVKAGSKGPGPLVVGVIGENSRKGRR